MPDIRSLYEKNYLGQWDVADKDIVYTMEGVSKEKVMDHSSHKERNKVCLSFKETDKKMVLNKTNSEIIATKLQLGYDYTKWPGHQIQLYKDPKVRFGKTEVGGLRIRPFLPNEQEEIFCEECGEKIESAYGMTPAQIAAMTKKKYGQVLCPACGQKRKEAAANEAE